MGDRGNIAVINARPKGDAYEGLYIYSHWTGSKLAGIVEKLTISRRFNSRIGDVQYLTRIIMCAVLMGDTIDFFDEKVNEAFKTKDIDCVGDAYIQTRNILMGDKGYGIGLRGTDMQHPLIVINSDNGCWWQDDTCPILITEIVVPAQFPHYTTLFSVSV